MGKRLNSFWNHFVVKNAKFGTIGILVALALVTPFVCSATPQSEVIETIEPHGRINWSRWMIYAVEITGPVSENREESKGETSVETDPLLFSDLFSTMKSVRIDSSTRLSDLIKQRSMIYSQLWGMIRSAEVVKREYLSNGAVELTLAFDMKGGFSQLALPAEIQPVPHIRTLKEPTHENQSRNGRSGSGTERDIAEIYTGLVLDARGLSAKPCMAPKIISESGQEVYGPAYVSREFAVQKGMAYYTCDLDAGKESARLGDRPVLVRALRTGGANRSDFVISNADAANIQGASRHLEFLKECKVAIVIDSW